MGWGGRKKHKEKKDVCTFMRDLRERRGKKRRRRKQNWRGKRNGA